MCKRRLFSWEILKEQKQKKARRTMCYLFTMRQKLHQNF